MKKIKDTLPAPSAPDPRRNGFASAEEAARFMGLSRAMITKLTAAGEMPHRRYGRALRIPWNWLLAQVEETMPRPAA
jgi:excisionase family DNA binding protein